MNLSKEKIREIVAENVKKHGVSDENILLITEVVDDILEEVERDYIPRFKIEEILHPEFCSFCGKNTEKSEFLGGNFCKECDQNKTLIRKSELRTLLLDSETKEESE